MSLFSKVVFQPGEDIYRQDEKAENVFLMNDGVVDLMRVDDYGSNQVIRSVKKGQIFGETALTGIHPRWFTAKAKTKVNCVSISVNELNKRVDEQDPFISALYKILAANLNAFRELDTDPEDELDIMIEMTISD